MAKTISDSSLQFLPQATITCTLSLKLHVNLANSIATGYKNSYVDFNHAELLYSRLQLDEHSMVHYFASPGKLTG